MVEKHPAQLLLEKGLGEVGATSATLYMRDPYWTEELRLIYMPGVLITEPMHGFLIPQSAKRIVTEGDDELFLFSMTDWEKWLGPGDRSVPSLNRQNALFGNFAQRENVCSSARFIHRTDKDITAVLFVNFSNHHVRFDSHLRSELKSLMHDMVVCLPSIERNVRALSPFPVSTLLQVLQPFKQLTTIYLETTGPSLESYLGQLLRAALAACGIGVGEGFGTVHLFNAHSRMLELMAYEGVPEASLVCAHLVAVESGSGVISWVTLKRRGILIPHLPSSSFKEIHIPIKDDTVTELAVPMMAGEEVLGVFNIETSRGLSLPLASDLLRIIWYAANQAAIACRMSRQVSVASSHARAARKHADVSESLLEICSNAPDSVDSPRPLDAVARLAASFFRADKCDIWEYDLRSGGFRGVGATYEDFIADAPPRTDGWSQFVHDYQLPVWISCVSSTETFQAVVWDFEMNGWVQPVASRTRFPAKTNDRLIELEVGSELGMPIRLKNVGVGIMWLKFRNRYQAPPDKASLKAVRGLAGQAALVMSCFQRQREQQELFSTEGLRFLIDVLRHEAVGKLLGKFHGQIARSSNGEELYAIKEDLSVGLAFLQKYIDQLSWYTKSESDLSYDPRVVNLHAMVQRAIELADVVQRTPICCNRMPSDLYVAGDEMLLILVFFNLIHNAKKFTADHRVEEPIVIDGAVECEPEGGRTVQLKVDDAGIGVPPSILSRIGDVVGTAMDAPGRSCKGGGLGVFLCRRIIEAHKGTLPKPATSARGGTSFSVFLPLIEVQNGDNLNCRR